MNFIDPTGLETEVIFWEPVGNGASSFGHVSVRIDGTSYSFGPTGMAIMPSSDYVGRNGFRDGHGYILNLSPEAEGQLRASLSASPGKYSSGGNNCTTPVQLGLWGGTYTYLPRGLEHHLQASGLVIGETSYQAPSPAPDHGNGLGDRLLYRTFVGFWNWL